MLKIKNFFKTKKGLRSEVKGFLIGVAILVVVVIAYILLNPKTRGTIAKGVSQVFGRLA